MTSKERMIAAMNFEKIDRTPAYLLDGSSWVIKNANMNYTDQFALEDYGSAMIYNDFVKAKSDCITTGSSAVLGWVSAFGGSVNLDNVGTTMQCNEAFSKVPDEIPNMTDEEIRQAFLNDPITSKMFEQNRRIKEMNNGEKLLHSWIAAPFTAAFNLVGARVFMKLAGKRKPEIEPLLDFAARIMAIYADMLYESGADFIMAGDPVASGDMIPLALYEAYAAPAFRKMTSLMKTDAPLGVHICGNAGDRVEFITSYDRVKLFSVDSMVDMEDMLKRCDHKICMMGNLNPTEMMMQGTPEAVYAECCRLIELGYKNGGGFLLSTGCDCPAGTSFENIWAMTKACEDMAEKYNK
ncbi:MAG: uroporphyrinogen decarboxylase family protein [Lachnospiraceae bacterium]|nr:uroporphyrinogen decarboxylase family protein [Lachnospiraceae bacterium]